MRAFIAICLAMIIVPMAGQDMPKNQTVKTFQGKTTKTLKAEYLLFLPAGYKEDAGKKWPLMLFLHGAGERGSDIRKVAVHGPPKIVKDRPDFPFILVSPQCPSGQSWSDDLVLGLLDEVMKEYRVDAKRVYLTGLSMGGYETWSLGLRYPSRFAAIAPICGGGSTLPILLPDQGQQAALKKLPVWVFHGGKDPVVKLEESERLVHMLKAIGNQNVKFTVYPEAGHDSWTEAYKNPELYDWLLEQSRGAKPEAGKAKRTRKRVG